MMEMPSAYINHIVFLLDTRLVKVHFKNRHLRAKDLDVTFVSLVNTV